MRFADVLHDRLLTSVAVNTDGLREILCLAIGPSEAEPFWTSFLRSLTRRGLRGVKLVICDAREGLKAAAAKVLKATWQRCRAHYADLRIMPTWHGRALPDAVNALVRSA